MIISSTNNTFISSLLTFLSFSYHVKFSCTVLKVTVIAHILVFVLVLGDSLWNVFILFDVCCKYLVYSVYHFKESPSVPVFSKIVLILNLHRTLLNTAVDLLKSSYKGYKGTAGAVHQLFGTHQEGQSVGKMWQVYSGILGQQSQTMT